MMDSLHEFFWQDSRARGLVYAISTITGILYATTRALVFHQPERRVAFELLALLLILNLVAISLYCSRIRLFRRKERVSPISYRLPPFIRYSGAIACLILFSAPRLSVSTVQAAIVNQRLQRAAASVEPTRVVSLPSDQLKSRFEKISSIADTSMQYRIHADATLIDLTRNNLEQTLRSVSASESARKSGIAAFVALIAYARYNRVIVSISFPTVLIPKGGYTISTVPISNGSIWWEGQRGGGSTIFGIPTQAYEPVFPISQSNAVFDAVSFNGSGFPRAFVGTDGKSMVLVMNATVEGASQSLGSIVWLNVRFKDSEIMYDGSPLYLENVTFENCRFKFRPDGISQKALSQIKGAGNNPVTLTSGL